MMNKTFDCIGMKRDIHRKMLQELKDLSIAERVAKIEQEVLSDPMLSDFWRHARRISEPYAKPAISVLNK